jgi:cardiolipin synthase
MNLKPELTIPNILTFLRLFAVPVLCYLISQWPSYRLGAFLLFIGIWLTDMLDGFIARRFNMTSDFGKLFDPLVDKIFQLSTALTMHLVGRMPLWVVIFMFVREPAMVIGSIFLLKQRSKVVYSNILGKIATFLFVLAFVALFWVPDEPAYVFDLLFVPPVAIAVLATVTYTLKNFFNREVPWNHDH